MADVDNSTWDGNRAMTECKSAEDYNKVCAGKKAGDASLRSSHALPHHYLSKYPAPNADGVRAALQRFSSTQGLTNSAAARAHLEAHMSSISPDQEASFGGGLVHLNDDLNTIIVRAAATDWEVRHSGRPDESFTVRGYAAVFNQLSLDLGGFKEQIDARAFDAVLATNPDVHFVWDHDTRYVGARTRNGTLALRADQIGLFMDAQVGNYSWAKDLRTALERGDIDQGSFKFHVGEDDWDHDGNGNITRTVRSVDGLYDVTVTAQGAYPQTSVAVARSLIASARAAGRLPEEAGAALVAERGEQPSHEGGVDAEVRQKAEELRHLAQVRIDEINALIEKAGRL